MGYITAIKDYNNTTTLFTFTPINISQQKDVERKSGTYAVIGADSGIDPYGLNAAPLTIQNVQYTFRCYFGPGTAYATFDDAWDAIARIVMPGLPQTLVYTTDQGRVQYRQARPLKISHVVTPASFFYADFAVTWELQGSAWTSGNPTSVKLWGAATGLWGAGTGVWGQTTTALPSVANIFTCDMRTATAPDTGPIITVTGPFGTQTGTSSIGNGFQVTNTSLNPQMYFVINDYSTVSDVWTIDCGAMSVLKNGQPAYSLLAVPPSQQQWLRLDPGIINSIVISDNPGSSQNVGGRGRVDFFLKYF